MKNITKESSGLAIAQKNVCRHCGSELRQSFVDLGFAPPSNAYLTLEALSRPEIYYPLRVMVCNQCWLVQTLDFARSDELFMDDYAYFSSTSTSWLNHAKRYAEHIISKLGLGSKSLVVELASNDGYLLKNFLQKSIPCFGIEPTTQTANAAKELGISVVEEFFSEKLADDLVGGGKMADLIIGNNVYAHVPDINDFTKGIAKLLKASGVVTLEFPHLAKLIEFSQFDTIYHEHFSYLSLHAVQKIFQTCGLKIYDVEELSTHGGSLRIYGCRGDSSREVQDSVTQVLDHEIRMGLQGSSVYSNFQLRVDRIKNSLLEFLLKKKAMSSTVAGYGAAAKGNTILNYAGVKPDLLPIIYDAAPSKQGRLMPGSHIPIKSPSELMNNPPDFLIVFPWNIAAEIVDQLSDLKASGTKIISFVPEIHYW